MARIKFLASQTHPINQYRYIRIKVLKCCAIIYFNRQCLIKKITPKYADIKIPYMSPATYVTQDKIQSTRLKDEIKFLYSLKAKDKLLSSCWLYVLCF